MRLTLASLAGQVLGRDPDELARLASSSSFVALGGTSLRAAELTILAAEKFGRSVRIDDLLGDLPLADIPLSAKVPDPVQAANPPSDNDRRELGASQTAMIFAADLFGDAPFHLLFSAEIRGALDRARLVSAVQWLVRRHEALRTVFERHDDEVRRRVIQDWSPAIIDLGTVDGAGAPAESVHALLASSSKQLLRPFEQPPVVFGIARAGAEHHVLTVLIHHLITDGWSIGLAFSELADRYAHPALPAAAADAPPTPAPTVESLVWAERSAPVLEAVADRVADLAGAETVIELPSDLIRPAKATRAGCRLLLTLSDETRRDTEKLATACGVTRNCVLIAAWSLAVARRCGRRDLIIGVAATGRRDAAAMNVFGLCTKMMPLRCEITAGLAVSDFLRATATRLRAAMAVDVPIEFIVDRLGAGGDLSRNPLVQIGFAAHDDLIPGRLAMGDLDVRLHEGHCGGTVFDAMLYVQSWDAGARFALEYSPSVLRPDEASALATSFRETLAELAADAARPLDLIRTLTARERERLLAWGGGAGAGAGDGAGVSAGVGDTWELVRDTASRCGDRVAVRDGDPARTLTYRELLAAVAQQHDALAAAGVGPGDLVGFAGPRSAKEVVVLLAIMARGAAYIGIERNVPRGVLRGMLDLARPRAVVGEAGDLAALSPVLDSGQPIEAIDPWLAPSGGELVRDIDADPERLAYVAFSSGSTGVPKGIQIRHSGVLRLVRDAEYLRPGATDRFLRLAPLAFDASTLEIFAPLATGGTVEVYPERDLTPAGLADFAGERELTGMWLTAGLFRLVADHRPDTFTGVRQVLTGGDVVPPAQVRKVLRLSPGLRITNGYGPTENTTFTTVHHVDDPAQVRGALPIGRPISGTGVVVLDDSGRMVPAGGVGELYVFGAGVAAGYLHAPELTAKSFGRMSPELDHVLYRTGDLVRWDADGCLAFLGRHDHQVKIRGFRVELDGITDVLRQHPSVHDAVVVAAQSDGADRRLLAAVVAAPAPGLLAELRRFAAQRLPAHAVPSLWVVTQELPTTKNGKLDGPALERAALGRRGRDEHEAAPGPPDVAPADRPATLEFSISSVWHRVLGVEVGSLDVGFFDAGGDSIRLMRAHAQLSRMVPEAELSIADLYRYPTIRALADHLRGRQARIQPSRSASGGTS